MYGDKNMAKWTGEKLAENGEVKPGGYVLLSNVYASGGQWVDVLSTRELMNEKGEKKSGGCSWIEVRNSMHVFYSRDESHVQWPVCLAFGKVVWESSGVRYMDTYSLKAVTDLPATFRSVFSFRYFNSLQSECFPTCFHSDINMVISAPTGSGKTVLFELCIMRLISKFINSDGSFIHHKGTLKTRNSSIMFHLNYVILQLWDIGMNMNSSPSKALVQEKLRDWTQKLGQLGMNCLELTGDNDNYSIKSIQDADIILTTPEKFDAVTRYRAKDGGLSFFSDIALVLIDEVHLLNDPRGAALEAIISRIKMLACNPEMKSSSLSHVRFLAVSATIPNIYDLAEWLMVPTEGIKRFGEEMRPVKLTTKVFGYTPAKNDFLFEKKSLIADLLMQYSGGKSALVFCSTRKGAQEAAQRLSQIAMTFGHSSPFIKSREHQERLREASLSCSDKQMQSYIVYGGESSFHLLLLMCAFGYHNGGLSMKDRSLIEGLFLNGDLQILCTTNTLAHGINLPAHTVVIKSTQYFNKEKGMYMEYERSMISQMCGRAGRPPFDDSGMVIIMTRKETVHLYENLLSGCEVVESQLLPCVTEHLTAEIVQSTVSDITMAIEWMKSSFLYNPENYSILKGLPGNRIERHLQEICVQKVNELSEYQLVWTDEDGFLLKPLGIQLRRNEKKLLNDINTDKDGRLRFHILDDKGKRKKRIQTREEKIFVLVNDCLTGDPLVHDLSMSQDMNSICSNGSRIAKCVKEYFMHKKSYKGALNSMLLAKCLHQKLWDDSPYLLKQLPGIGMVTAKALHSMGIKSFESLSEADPRKIELVTGRKYPFGNHIKDSLLSLPPKVEMLVEETEGQKLGKSKLLLTLTRISEVQSAKRHYADMVVGIEEDNIILYIEKIRLEEFSSPYCATVLYPSPQIGTLTIKADLIFEEFIGIDIHQKVIVTPKVDLDAINKYRLKERSSFQKPKDDRIIKEDKYRTSHAPSKENSNYNELIENSISMPSFNLIDEDFEDGDPVVETEDDDCKIVSEKTVFDHIRRKAKSLPVLPLHNDTCSPSLETFTLIRKRTREMHLELENDIEVLEVLERNKIPQSRAVIPSPIVAETEQNRPILLDAPDSLNGSYLAKDAEIRGGEGTYETRTKNIESFTLTEETIFEHIRKKSKNFPTFDNLKSTNTELLNMDGDSNRNNVTIHEGFFDGSNEIDAETTYARMDKQNIKDISRSGISNTYSNIGFPSKDPYLGLRMNQMPSFSVSMGKHDIELHAESNVKHLSSPSLSKKQCGSLGMVGLPRKEDPFLGFQSVFSFL
ncbi:hypothetical protein RD792_016595 [Penstemon davidsonii]|uniref:Uncharacterized protein n=1 Tax=Penstemon davidsonii TaxID=160366 RepID=A0ABR0CKR3_9LAMI|nr:hypothetical protein RD792_016595 [Penstemon davidsonii]